jgi:two-component system response regulator BaeR
MRIKALLRRYAPPPAANAPSLQLDAEQQRAFWNGKRLELTAQQFRLLEVLSSRPGHVFSRSQLLELAYADTAEVSDRAIDSLIKNLRKRLAAEVPGQEFIHSVYGVGYRYEIEPA